MGNERRNYSRRAETMRRIVERLLEARNGLRPEDLVADGVAPAGVPERILKRMARRGLVFLGSEMCIPKPVLLHASPLTSLGHVAS